MNRFRMEQKISKRCLGWKWITARCNGWYNGRSTKSHRLCKGCQKSASMGVKSACVLKRKGWKVIGETIKLSASIGIYYGAFFQDHLSLTDWVNSQRLLHPLICLGDGHDGVWNLFQEIGSTQQRQEILDWYHLKENLYKVGGSLKRLKAAETYLWQGRVEEASALERGFEKKVRPKLHQLSQKAFRKNR